MTLPEMLLVDDSKGAVDAGSGQQFWRARPSLSASYWFCPCHECWDVFHHVLPDAEFVEKP